MQNVITKHVVVWNCMSDSPLNQTRISALLTSVTGTKVGTHSRWSIGIVPGRSFFHLFAKVRMSVVSITWVWMSPLIVIDRPSNFQLFGIGFRKQTLSVFLSQSLLFGNIAACPSPPPTWTGLVGASKQMSHPFWRGGKYIIIVQYHTSLNIITNVYHCSISLKLMLAITYNLCSCNITAYTTDKILDAI